MRGVDLYKIKNLIKMVFIVAKNICHEMSFSNIEIYPYDKTFCLYYEFCLICRKKIKQRSSNGKYKNSKVIKINFENKNFILLI